MPAGICGFVAAICLEFAVRVPGSIVLFAVPIIAILMFGASLAMSRLDGVDQVMTGSIHLAP